MIRALLLLFLMFASAVPAAATYFAAPNGIDNPTCSPSAPCTAQGAFMRCHLDMPPGGVCNIQLADGDYVDPGINVFYYRLAALTGNCANVGAVRLIGTTPTALIWIQDHSIGIVRCMQLVAFVGGVVGIAGRQHVIIDYDRIVFGNMTAGVQIALSDHSIASCLGPVTIAGNAAMHAIVGAFSKLNLSCDVNINGIFAIDYFINTNSFSIVDASQARFIGNFNVIGTQCNLANAIVSRPRNGQAFPGSVPGNC